MMRPHLALLVAGFALSAPAWAQADPAPAATGGLTIEPSVTCRPGDQAEIIRLSKARGDAIDAVFALCRDLSLPNRAWISRLKTTRAMMVAAADGKPAKAAIRRAFTDHIARVRAAN